MHDPGVGEAFALQGQHHRFDESGVGDADHLTAHPAGVGHRSEQVERGRHPDLATRWPGEPEGRVEHRREAEADPGLANTGGDAVGMEFDRDAQQLEQVGAAALRRRGAVAVLAHRHAGPGDDQRRHRRHVDRVRSVATGADDVDAPGALVVGERHERSPVPWRCRATRSARRPVRPWPAAPPGTRRSAPRWRRRAGSSTSRRAPP